MSANSQQLEYAVSALMSRGVSKPHYALAVVRDGARALPGHRRAVRASQRAARQRLGYLSKAKGALAPKPAESLERQRKGEQAAGRPAVPCLSRINSIVAPLPLGRLSTLLWKERRFDATESLGLVGVSAFRRDHGPVATERLPDAPNSYTPAQRKQFHSVFRNIAGAAEEAGIGHCGFLTLTFADRVTSFYEASRRFNIWWTNHGRKMFQHALIVKELHLGRGKHRYGLHFHIFVVCHEPIQCDWDHKGNYLSRSANPALRALWKAMNTTLPGSGFGRPELYPVKANSAAIARYVSKYLVKGTSMRFIPGEVSLKGARLLNYTRGFPRVVKGSFSWVGEASAQYRRWVGIWCRNHGCKDLGQAKEKLGSAWHWRCLRVYRHSLEVAEDKSVDPVEFIFGSPTEERPRLTVVRKRLTPVEICLAKSTSV